MSRLSVNIKNNSNTVIVQSKSKSARTETLRYNPFFPTSISLGQITQELGCALQDTVQVYAPLSVEFVGNGNNPNSQSQMFFDDSADLAVVSFGNTPLANEPWWPLFTTWPFMPDPLTFVFWLLNGGGVGLLNTLLAPRNLVAIPCAGFSCAASGWSNLQITSAEQFDGLRTRAFGFYGDILTRLGADNVILNGPELVAALAAGEIDFGEFATPDMDVQIGLDRVAEFMYVPGWHENVQIFYLVWQRAAWEKVPSAGQTAVQHLCQSTLLNSLTQLAGDDAQVLRTLASQNRIVRWQDELLARFSQEWNSILTNLFQTNSTFAQVYTSIVQSETSQTLRREVLCLDTTSRPDQRPNGTRLASLSASAQAEALLQWLQNIAAAQINIEGIHRYAQRTVLTVEPDQVPQTVAAANQAGITVTVSFGVVVNISAVPGALVNTLRAAEQAGALNPSDIAAMLQTERGETVISFAQESAAATFASWASLRPSGVRAPPRTDGFPLVTSSTALTQDYIAYYEQFTSRGLNLDIFQSTPDSQSVGVPASQRNLFEPLVDIIVNVFVTVLDPVPGALLRRLDTIGFLPEVIVNTERGETTLSEI